MRDGALDPTPGGEPDIEAAWMAAMRAGDWARAWDLSDGVLAARAPDEFDRPGTPYHTRCVWDGRPLAGRRVLIRCYHGLGDTIQSLRFGPSLRRLGCTVMVEAQPELLALLRPLDWIEAAVPLGQADGLEAEIAMESMELAHALRVTPGTLPAAVPYLIAPETPTPAPGAVPRVGLVWRAGGWDPRRSMDLEELAPLLAVAGVEFHSLQLGAAAEDLARFGLTDGSKPQIEGLAATLAGLDLFVTVDTMAAHLAGALGRPVWTLLRAEADWRWGLEDRTPWYPTMRLHRQRREGDWRDPVLAAAAELARFARRWRRPDVPGP